MITHGAECYLSFHNCSTSTARLDTLKTLSDRFFSVVLFYEICFVGNILCSFQQVLVLPAAVQVSSCSFHLGVRVSGEVTRFYMCTVFLSLGVGGREYERMELRWVILWT